MIVGDVPMGVSPSGAPAHQAGHHPERRVSAQRHRHRAGQGFRLFPRQAGDGLRPVAVTPDELGDAWDGGKLNLPLISTLNGKEFGHPNAATDLTFDFGQLIAHAAKTRHLEAGTVVGSGTVANRDAGAGCSCIAERRVRRDHRQWQACDAVHAFGDRIRIEMFDRAGQSIFGAIDQKVARYTPA